MSSSSPQHNKYRPLLPEADASTILDPSAPALGLSTNATMSAIPPPPPATTSASSDEGFDVMAQLASQYYSVSRNRSFSAPIPPTSLGSTWHFQDDTSTSLASSSIPIDAPLPPPPQPPLPPPVRIMTPVGDPQVVNAAGAIGSGVPSLRGSFIGDLQSLHISNTEPENEPTDSSEKNNAEAAAVASGGPLPATFLRTICDQLEFYFCDENLLGDLFLLKNMNMDGYVKLELLASFGRVKKLTTEIDQIKKALELSTKLLLSEDETMVCRKEPLASEQTYHGKLARTAIAYNLPEDASVASLRETFQGCGEITYLRLLKKNTTTGRNAVLKPPIAAGETYAIIEFVDEEMAKHAVLTLSDQYNWRTGMQVVLFDGTNCDKLKQKMFPVEMGGERRRAKSASHAVARPVHVEQVGEGLEDLREGKVNTGIVYSIRGAGGLITPTRQDSACISFRLIPDEDGNIDIRQGDYVSFTVGKNKKSGRKYASKVKLEFRPPASLTGAADTAVASSGSSNSNGQKDYFSPSQSRWEGGRNRAATVGAQPPQQFRSRSSSTGTRPKLNLSSPRMGSSPPNASSLNLAVGPPGLVMNGSNPLYRQALGPDGTRGFGFRRTGEPEMISERKFSQPTERRRSSSSSAALQPY
ncbi:La-related protein 6-like, partial [Globisporangium splendens]